MLDDYLWSDVTPEQIKAKVAVDKITEIRPGQKGDVPGHDFHGNQWTGGQGGVDTSKLTGGIDPPNLDRATAEKRLTDLYDRAVQAGTAEADGAWYAHQHDVIGQWAQKAGVDPKTFTAMVAATSPQMAWDLPRSSRMPNLEAAQTVARMVQENPDKSPQELARDVPHPALLGASVEKAARLMKGEDPEQVLGGPKVRSFYNNLAYPDRSGPVTVDTHMGRALLDRHDESADAKKEVRTLIEGQRPRGQGVTVGGYGWAADRIRSAAAARGIAPHEMQAAAWTQWRREGGGQKDAEGEVKAEFFNEDGEVHPIRDSEGYDDSAAKGPGAPKRALGDALVVKPTMPGLETDKNDRTRLARHQADLAKVAPGLLRAYKEAGGKVMIATGSMGQMVPSLADKQPRGWPQSATWSTVPGGYSPTNATVYAGTRGGSGSVSLLLHELGHGMDAGLGRPSNSEEFRAIHTSLFNRLGPYYKQGGPGGPAGASELFAEAFAIYHAGGKEGLAAGGYGLTGRAGSPKLADYMANWVKTHS